MLKHQEEYPIAAGCRLLELAPSSYYYCPVEKDEQGMQAAIEEIAGRFSTYGSRRIAQELRRHPYRLLANRKRVQRLMGHMGLLVAVKPRKQSATNSQHPYPRYPNLIKDLQISYPDQVWVSDITYIRLMDDHVYLAIIMDVFTRAIRSWQLSYALDQDLTLRPLRDALQSRRPTIHHSDQGVQYAAYAYTDLLKAHDIQISMAAVGKAEENGYAERFMRTIKEEEVNLSDYRNFTDARQQIALFIDDIYMTKRIHSSLGYLTPLEYEHGWNHRQLEPAAIPP